tara:strand:- start:136 stop:1110 length:975 start_codon:yes stop_codon:yes gene_type:complete
MIKLKIILRKEAKEKNLKRYFTGIPCKRGHVSERTIHGGSCMKCSALRRKGLIGITDKERFIRDKEKAEYQKNATQKLITRLEARVNGLEFYFTGLPCPKNHISKRRSNSSGCYECEKDKTDEERAIIKANRKIYEQTESYKLRKNKRNKLDYAKNPKKYADRYQREKKKNPEKINAYNRKSAKKFYQTEKGKAASLKRQRKLRCDPFYRLSESLKNGMKSIFKKTKSSKTNRMVTYFGCSNKELIKHLENNFLPGMTWENYGRKKNIKCWEVDHVVPIAYFKKYKDLNDINIQLECWNYKNLQPLWKLDNLKKVQTDKIRYDL